MFGTLMIMGADAVNAASTVIDLSGVDFTPIVNAIQGAIPAVLTAIVPIVGVRKALSFVMGAVKGA